MLARRLPPAGDDDQVTERSRGVQRRRAPRYLAQLAAVQPQTRFEVLFSLGDALDAELRTLVFSPHVVAQWLKQVSDGRALGAVAPVPPPRQRLPVRFMNASKWNVND